MQPGAFRLDNHTRHHVHLFPEAVTTTAWLCSKRFWSGPLSVLYPSRHSSYSRLYQIPIAGKHAVILGRSPILGKPVSHMLLNRNATVTICHSKTNNLPLIIGIADIVVAAVGKPAFIQGAWMKEGAVFELDIMLATLAMSNSVPVTKGQRNYPCPCWNRPGDHRNAAQTHRPCCRKKQNDNLGFRHSFF